MTLDDEISLELFDGFCDLYEEVERSLSKLVMATSDTEELNCLFRAIHNVKGNAGMFGLTKIVSFTHALEDVAQSMRSGTFSINEGICDAILLGMDRLKDIHCRDLKGKHYDNLREETVIQLFENLARSNSALEVQEHTHAVLKFMGAGIDPHDTEGTAILEPALKGSESIIIESNQKRHYRDLHFFREISEQLDSVSPALQGRTGLLLEWTHKINKVAGDIVDKRQLSAAVYLHDLGMSLVGDEIAKKKKGSLTYGERGLLYKHPNWAHGFVSRISGWDEAAVIILQHHEYINGSGYPNQLNGCDIHPGAKILAIVDAFYSMVQSHSESGKGRSIIRAISSINARIDSHFEGMWVQCFNHMIRKELKAGTLTVKDRNESLDKAG